MPILLAERFPGTTPFYWQDAPANRREWLLSMLAFEGEVSRAYADLGPDDELDPHYFDED